jgi:hypothetical protein
MFYSYYLRSKLVLFWRQSLYNVLVKCVESITVGVVQNTDSVHLSIVWSHNSAVIADEGLGGFTVVLEGLAVDLAVSLYAH